MWGSVEAALQAEGTANANSNVHMCLAFSKKRGKATQLKQNGGKTD